VTNSELVEYWVESSDEDYDVMMSLYENKKFTWCLFLGHLVIEKLIKAIYAKRNQQNPYAPKMHNLVKLASLCELNIDQDGREKLGVFTRFNMEARYDDYKKEFAKKCTQEYAEKQVKDIEEMRAWLKTQLV